MLDRPLPETNGSVPLNERSAYIELTPQAQADPYAYASPFVRVSEKIGSKYAESCQLLPMLYEIPSLRGINIAKAVASDRSSYALTKDGGKVLAWGANEYGYVV